ncbi:hypothetical protein PGI88_004333 [Vibrio vulnificus]|nr:hypothetical protein [Vibrio vulnificus]
MKNREFIAYFVAAIMFAKCYILFGILIGRSNFETDSTGNVFNIISSLGSFLSGIGTISLLIFGVITFRSWSKDKSNDSHLTLSKNVLVFRYKVEEWYTRVKQFNQNPDSDLVSLEYKSDIEQQIKLLLEHASELDCLSSDTEHKWYLSKCAAIQTYFYLSVSTAFAVNLNSDGTDTDLKKQRNSQIDQKRDQLLEIVDEVLDRLKMRLRT